MTHATSCKGGSPDRLIAHLSPPWLKQLYHFIIKKHLAPSPKPPPRHPHGKPYLIVHFVVPLQQNWEVVSWLLGGMMTKIPHLQQSMCTHPAPTHGWGYPMGIYQCHDALLLQHNWKLGRSSLWGEKRVQETLPQLFLLPQLKSKDCSSNLRFSTQHPSLNLVTSELIRMFILMTVPV